MRTDEIIQRPTLIKDALTSYDASAVSPCRVVVVINTDVIEQPQAEGLRIRVI